MAGIISPSMPLWVVENRTHGNRAYSNFNEGLGKVLRFGANGPEVIDRLRWIASELAPALRATLARTGRIELMPLMAQALNMGDEVHNRNAAATALLFKRLAPALFETDVPRDAAAKALAFIAGNDHFFLNLSMAACKAMLDAAAERARQLDGRRDGAQRREFRHSSRGDRRALVRGAGQSGRRPVLPRLLGRRCRGRSRRFRDHGNRRRRRLRDGRRPRDRQVRRRHARPTRRTTACACARSRSASIASFTLPSLDFAPAAAGIDARKVVDTGILPVINSGIAHRQAGVGQIGAGVTYAPMACFAAAVKALAREIGARTRA